MRKKLDLEKGNLSELFISFAMPATISLIMTFLYSVADGIFITRGVGSNGIAAVNIGYPIINFTVALSLMFGIGGATLITFKKGNIRLQNRYFTHIIFLNVVVYIIVAAIIFLFTNPVMMALGASEELLPMIKGYMYPCTVSTSFLMIATSLNAVVRSDNAPKRAMQSTLIGAGMNIVLDYLFIFKFHLGIEGGAYATAISQIAAAIYLCRHFVGSTFKLDLSWRKLNFKIMRRIINIGFPSFILEFAVAVITVLLNIAFMKEAGVFAASAYGIISYSFMLFRMLFTGLSQGIQPIVSYNYGKRNYERTKQILAYTHKVTFVISLISLVLIIFFGKYMVNIFTSDKELLKESVKGFILYSAALSFLGFNFVNIAYLQAVDKPRISNVICMSRSFVFVFIGLLILPKFWGINGIWLSLPFADFVTAILTLPFYKKITNSYNEALKNKA